MSGNICNVAYIPEEEDVMDAFESVAEPHLVVLQRRSPLSPFMAEEHDEIAVTGCLRISF